MDCEMDCARLCDQRLCYMRYVSASSVDGLWSGCNCCTCSAALPAYALLSEEPEVAAFKHVESLVLTMHTDCGHHVPSTECVKLIPATPNTSILSECPAVFTCFGTACDASL